MAVAANALLTLADAKSYLTIVGTGDDAKLEIIINRMADVIEGYCNRPLKEAAYALRLRGPDSTRLRPRAWPINITATLTIKKDGTVQTIWKQESDGNPGDFDVIVGSDFPELSTGQRDHLYRSSGWKPTAASNPYDVLLTFTGGFAVIPDDLQEAACLVLQKLWRDQQKQLAEITAVTLQSGSITLFDTVMPRRALFLLAPYRIVPI